MTKFENSWGINTGDVLARKWPEAIGKRPFSSQTFSRMDIPTILNFFHYRPICLWRWNRHSVPKRWHIKFRRRGITQKKTQHTEHGESLKSKIWEYWSLLNVLLRILKIWLLSQYDETSDNLPRYYAKPEAACTV